MPSERASERMQAEAGQIHIAWRSCAIQDGQDVAQPDDMIWGDALFRPSFIQRLQSAMTKGTDHGWTLDCRLSPVKRQDYLILTRTLLVVSLPRMSITFTTMV